MGFLQLPSEIIDIILDLSLPGGIESLALTCKAIYGRAKSQIERHNTLKRRWKFTNTNCSPHQENILGILYEIALDPLAAKYIEVLDLWDRRDIERRDHYHEGLGYSVRADMAGIRDLALGSTFYLNAQPEDGEGWWDDMFESMGDGSVVCKEDEGWRAMAVLLSLLPNLRVLNLAPSWELFRLRKFEEVLRGITGMAMSTNSGSEPPLSKLRYMLPADHSGYRQRAPLRNWQPFMTLKTLKEMYLVSMVAVDDGYTGYPFEWKYPGLVSSITRLELVSSCMDADGLSNLIAYTPELSIFRYSHEVKWHGCGYEWNPGTFVETLAHHCGNTLREVAITIDALYGDVINGASSFLALPNIEQLEVDVQIFCGPPVESGQRLGLNAFVPPGDRAWTKEDIPCIGSMLPNNVKEIHINTGIPEPDATALQSLLKNLVSQRKERLHNLSRVIIREHGDDTTQTLAKWAGATFEYLDSSIFRSRMPLWKRQFEDRVKELAGPLAPPGSVMDPDV